MLIEHFGFKESKMNNNSKSIRKTIKASMMSSFYLLLISLIWNLNCATEIEVAHVHSGFEQQVASIVNTVRFRGTRCGDTIMQNVSLLKWNQSLANAARDHSIDMAGNNYFNHTSLDGRTFSDRIKAAGYHTGGAIGENIANGERGAAVMTSFLGNVDSCMNIMSPLYKEIGVGCVFDSSSKHKYYWTLLFAAQ